MTTTVRVAQIITRLSGGAGGVALRGALALDPREFTVNFITGPGSELVDAARRSGLDVQVVEQMSNDLRAGTDVQAIKALRDVLCDQRVDLVHTHSSKAGALGRMAARVASTPGVVHTFHGFPFNDFQSRFARTAFVGAERVLARITDRFLAVGSALAAEAVRRRIAPADRIRVIDGVVAPGIQPATPERRLAARSLLGIATTARVVGTVGRLDPAKSPRDFFRAAAMMHRRDVVFVWVGDGPLRSEAEHIVDALDLRSQVMLLGDRDDVVDILPAFDVFAMSSLHEGLPCAIVEAMLVGTPVVATAINSIPDVVVPGRTGLLVPPRNPRSLGRAISYLLDDEVEARRLGEAAQRSLVGRFEVERLGVDLAQTYTAALDDSRVRCAGRSALSAGAVR